MEKLSKDNSVLTKSNCMMSAKLDRLKRELKTSADMFKKIKIDYEVAEFQYFVKYKGHIVTKDFRKYLIDLLKNERMDAKTRLLLPNNSRTVNHLLF